MANFSRRATLRASTAAATILYFALLGGVGSATAQDRALNIPAASLSAALNDYSRATGQQILVEDSLIRGLRTQGLQGTYSTAAALDRLLAGTGLAWRQGSTGSIAIVKATASPQTAAAAENAELVDEVLVTGSRIRGAPPTSSVIAISAEDIRNAGQSNLGEVARNIPQSFAGGQNPTVATGAPGGSLNVNSASSLNLRGLGPDATLTLLNGHRLSYTSAAQAIDISSIPVAAVDRLEVMVDGASALYGSDAVAGVANVILKRDFDGFAASANYGFASDGGNERRQLSLVGGKVWSDGGFIVAVDDERLSAIKAGDRSYASALHPTTMLTPEIHASLGVLSAHQQIGPSASIAVDALVGKRKSHLIQPLQTADEYRVRGQSLTPETTSFSLAPRIHFDVTEKWAAEISAVYARDKTTLNTLDYTAGQLSARYPGTYNNTLSVIEASSEGPILRLPAGDVRLAVGAGYRKNELRSYLAFLFTAGTQTISRDYRASNDSYYGYGELYVPAFRAKSETSFLQRASVTGAARWENYGAQGDIVTPKLGGILETSIGLSAKGSWGKSFKAPTLDQLYQPSTPSLYSPTFFSSTTYAATEQVLHLSGGNADLDPERAETWSVALEMRPAWLPGAHLEVSYFEVEYRGRVVAPIVSARALENPLYVNFVTQRPDVSAVNAAISKTTGALRNNTSRPFDAARIVAIVDARLQNANRQTAQGVDVAARYDINLKTSGSLTLMGAASYLKSDQRLEADSIPIELAGTIGRPPHLRGRLGATWSTKQLTLSGYGTYVGGVVDNRLAQAVDIKSMTTFDMTSRYAFGRGGITNGLKVSASVLNLFNKKPDRIRTTSAYYPPYDSTNYSATGRYIGLSIEKAW